MSEGRRARPQPTPERSISGTAPRPASCACSAATPAARCISRRARSARPAPRARSASSRVRQGRLYSYVIHHRRCRASPALCDRRRRARRRAAHDDQHHRCPQTPEALRSTCRSRSPSRSRTITLRCPFPPGEGRLTRCHTTTCRHCRRRRDHETRRHSRHVADPVACRRRAQRDGRCRAQTQGHRRRRDRRRDAGARSRTISGITPKWVDGTAVGGCSFMIHVRHAAAAIDSGLCKTVLITHGESGRSGVGRTRNVAAPTQPRRPVRAALRADGAADFVHDPGAALHEDLRPHPRAVRDGLGRAARMGGEKPARHLQGPDHRRRRAELADDRLPVPAIAVLPGDRRRRRADPGLGRARPGLPAKAGLPARHRRERRDADGQPDGGFHLVARLPRRRRQRPLPRPASPTTTSTI